MGNSSNKVEDKYTDFNSEIKSNLNSTLSQALKYAQTKDSFLKVSLSKKMKKGDNICYYPDKGDQDVTS